MGALENALLVSVIIRAIDGASPIFRSLGLTGMASMGGLVGAAALVAAGIGAIGVVSIKMATEFDQSMQRIAALTTTSQQQMQDYKDQILQMAPQLDQSPKALADALYFVISASYQGSQALDILNLSAKAAAATFTDMPKVADLLTTAMNSFRRQSLSAGHAMDDIIKIVVNGKVTMSSLATSFGFVATTAANAGLTFDETSAAVSALSQIAGEHGARRVMMDLDNALRNLGPKMEDVSAKAAKMKGLKEPWDAAAFALMNFGDKIKYIASETGGIGYLDQTQALAYEATGNFQNLAQATAHANKNFMDLVGGAAAFLPIAMLLNDKGASYDNILKQMGGDGEATAKAFDSMRQSTGQQWRMFLMTLESIATAIGLHILPVVNVLLQGMIGLAHGILAFVGNSKSLDALKWALLGIGIVLLTILLPALATMVAGIFAALAPIVAVIAAGVILGNIIHALVDHFGGWHAIMQKLQPIITTVQDAVSGLAKDIQKGLASPEMQEAIKQFKQALPELLPVLKALAIFFGVQLVVAFELFRLVILGAVAILPKLIEVGTAVIHLLGYIFSGKIFQDLGNALGAIKAKIGDFFNALGTKVHDGLAAIGQFFSDRWDDIRNGVGGFFNGLGTDVHNGIENVKNQFLSSIHHIGDAFGWLYNHNYYWQRIVDFIRAKIEWLKGIIHTVLTAIQAAWTATLQRIQSFVSQQWKRITDFLGERVEAAKTAIHNALTLIEQRWEAFKAAVSATVQIMGTWLYDHLIKPIGDFLGYIGGIKDKIGTFFHDNVIKPITDLVGNLITAAEDWGKNLIDHFINGLKGKAGDLKNAAGGVFQNIAGWFGFHSPAPFVPESAYWGPNLIKMFASGMLANAHLVGNAAQGVIGQAGAGLTGGASGAGGGGLPLVGAGAGGGGGTTTINVYFPNATSRDEITAAIRQVQQGDYRAGRRAGGYGGLRAGISPQ